MDYAKSQVLKVALTGGLAFMIVFLAYENYTKKKLDKIKDQGAAFVIIPEEKIDIDNIDRLSRYTVREEYKNPEILGRRVGGDQIPAEKINTILQMNKDLKNKNFNYMVNELARDDYVDSSTEQWRKKIFSEYVFQ